MLGSRPLSVPGGRKTAMYSEVSLHRCDQSLLEK